MKPAVWSIAGTDPTGASGVFADLATFADFDVHGCAVITAVVAQNSRAVSQIQFVSASVLRAQMESLAAAFPPRCVKVGMLGRAAAVKTVAEFLKKSDAFAVCDPVMISSSGGVLLDAAGQAALKKYLFPHIDLLTPNIPEAEKILGRKIRDVPAAAAAIVAMGVKSVLIKGGHAAGDESRDFWTDGNDVCWFTGRRIKGRKFRGTGCALSSAIAGGVASGRPLKAAMASAKKYVAEAMQKAEIRSQGKWMLARGICGTEC